jgi:hypothetical protein
VLSVPAFAGFTEDPAIENQSSNALMNKPRVLQSYGAAPVVIYNTHPRKRVLIKKRARARY